VIPCGKALLYADRSTCSGAESEPELRLVVLGAAGSAGLRADVEGAMAALFGGEASTVPRRLVRRNPVRPHGEAGGWVAGSEALSRRRLGFGRLSEPDCAGKSSAEAGQKLEDLKRKLDLLQAGQ